MRPLIPVPMMQFDELDVFLLELQQHDKEIQAGVASVGEAAAYALVWEFGDIQQTKQGPKTTRGYNIATGEEVWMTIQRPYGYIRLNENLYWEIVKDEMGKVTFKGNTAHEITKELEACALRAVKRIRVLLEETAPVDRGTLSDSFVVVDPGDVLLEKNADYILDIG
jgi:hypothetical protein